MKKLDQLLQDGENHLRDIQSHLHKLEALAKSTANRGIDSSTTTPNDGDEELPGLKTYVNQNFDQVESIVSLAQALLLKPSASPFNGTSATANQPARAAHKMRIDQLIYDARQLRTNVDSILARAGAQAKACRDRETLLATKFLPNDSSFHHRPGHEAINMMADENVKLKDSGQQVDYLLDAGRAVMDGLRSQRGLLQKSHKRLNDIINALGLSNSVMRIIERRTAQDKVILYGGMAITTVLIFMILVYLR